MASFFEKLGDTISRPFRGIGRIVRGKFREGLEDIGHGAKNIAPVVLGATGVGLPAAIAAGAAGGALERGAQKGADFGDVLGGAAGGAASGALGHTGGRVLRGIPSLFSGGGAAASTAASTVPPGTSGFVNRAAPVVGRVGVPGAASIAPGATSVAGGGIGNTLRGIGRVAAAPFRGASEFVSDLNMPQAYLLSQGIGTGLQAIGQHQMAAADEDERRRLREEEERERRRRQGYAPALGALLRSQMMAA